MKGKNLISAILCISCMVQAVFTVGAAEIEDTVFEYNDEFDADTADIYGDGEFYLTENGVGDTPSIHNLRITGSPVVGETLNVEYECSDPNFDTSQITFYWVSLTAPYVSNAGYWMNDSSLANGTGYPSYTIPEMVPNIADRNKTQVSPVGKYIAVYAIVPGYKSYDSYSSIAVGPVMAEKPEKPVVSGVSIRNRNEENGGVGTKVNDILEGEYCYSGINNEGESTYQWYWSDSEQGEYLPIPGATEKTYCVQNAYYKKHLMFEVKPKDTEGTAGDKETSVNRPQVGNVAYNAFITRVDPATGVVGRCFSSFSTIVNGLTGKEGGDFYTYRGPGVFTIQLDFRRVSKIDSSVITMAGADDYSVSYYDEESAEWKVLLEKCDPLADKQMSFDPVNARYVRIAYSRATGSDPHFYEASFFAKQDMDPTLTLNGEETMNLLVGETYVEPGATVQDTEDGEISCVIDGTVDTSVSGKYTVTYTATDKAGNKVSKVRTVNVAEGFKTEGDELYNITPDVSIGENPEKLTDGNKYTGFSGNASEATMTFSLGEMKYLSRMILESAKDNIKNITIEGSADGSSWSKMYSGTETDANFVPKNVSYVRVTVTFTSSEFDLRTLEMSFDDVGRVIGAKDALQLDGDLSALTENLGLPKNGEFGTTITWKTSDASVITDNGTIKRDSSSNKSAVLTAMISCGDVSDEKEFEVTVKKKAASSSGGGGGGGGGSASLPAKKPSTNSDGGVTVNTTVTTNKEPLPTYPPQEILNGDFTDIKEHWANEYIVKLKELDIVSGRADNIFEPEGQITRAEFVKMILGAFGMENENAVSSFKDVPEESWCYPYISAAYELGITDGISEDTFGVNMPITRQDMAVIAYRAAAAAKRDMTSGEDHLFTDNDKISDYAVEAVTVLARVGIFSGDDNGNFRPTANATRAESAKIVCMLRELPVITADGSTPAPTEEPKDTSKISAPFDLDKAKIFLNWTPQGIVRETEEELIERSKPYIDLSEEELVKTVALEQRSQETLGQTNAPFESAIGRMSVLYLRTKDEKYARRAILAMNAAAQNFDRVPKVQRELKDLFPGYSIFAYNNLYDSPLWDTLSGETGNDCRAAVEEWFTKISLNAYENNIGVYKNNLEGYGLRPMAAAAVVMDKPELVRNVIELIDCVYDDREWFADGMWYEGTISYADQIISTCDDAVKIISYYTDPDGYVDSRLGLQLKRTNLYDIRWPVRGVGKKLNDSFRYPNGHMISINDTHPVNPKNNNYSEPIQEKYLKNVEANHYGFFSLTSGNTTDAQTATLLFPQLQMGGGGHTHYCFLSMTMFGGGTDVLPDQGYPFQSGASNRFFHMCGLTHNQSFITPAKATGESKDVAQAQLLAYDDGVKNDKQVQVVEASECMSKVEGIDTKRRMLVTVKTSDSTSYVFDMQRLKGGTVHENFLRASEYEDCELITDLELQNKQMTLPDFVASVKGRGGVATGIFSDKIITEKIGTGYGDFSFTWKGEESGTAVNMFIKGEPNTNLAFSMMPTFRRTMDDQIPLKDAFPNWHFYQRRDVDPEDVTRFSGVYEAVRDGETGYIETAEWIDIDPDYPMCSIAKITGKDFVDYIYVSDDLIERKYDGISFSGQLAVIRIKSGKAEWGYLYSEGTLSYAGFTLNGNQRQKFNVIATEGTKFDEGNYKLELNTSVKNAEDVKDRWIMEIFGDGSGKSHKILNVEKSTLQINNLPGYQVTDDGAVMQCYPTAVNSETKKFDEYVIGLKNEKQYVAEGDVNAFIDIPVFKKAQ